MPNFIALGNILHFWEPIFWDEGIDTCFNVECVLLGRNFDFLGGYLVVTARYLVVTVGYCSILGGYCSSLVVTARSCSLLFVPSFRMNDYSVDIFILNKFLHQKSSCSDKVTVLKNYLLSRTSGSVEVSL